MKASLIWDRVGTCPPVRMILLNKAPHIQYLPEMPSLSQALRQLDLERPELVFFAVKADLPDYTVLMRNVRSRAPGCFVISFAAQGNSSRSGADLVLPAMWTEKQLLDGVFQAELHRAGAPVERETSPIQVLPSPKAFLEELDDELFTFPDQTLARHWQRLEEWMKHDPENVGWHLVSLTALMADRMRKTEGCPVELETVYSECLRILSGSPSLPMWKDAYDKLCALYVAQLQSGGDTAGQQIVRICQYIDKHIEEDVSLKRVAQEFFLSSSYLSRLFKSKTGVNFSHYISSRKLERAKSLLVETDLTIAEISSRLGYPEQNSFSRFFKGKVGIPPQVYRTLNAGADKSKEREKAPEPVLEDFDIMDFGPCAFTTEDMSYAYSFHKRT